MDLSLISWLIMVGASYALCGIVDCLLGGDNKGPIFWLIGLAAGFAVAWFGIMGG